jgi:hypothetical protein
MVGQFFILIIVVSGVISEVISERRLTKSTGSYPYVPAVTIGQLLFL